MTIHAVYIHTVYTYTYAYNPKIQKYRYIGKIQIYKLLYMYTLESLLNLNLSGLTQ